jgi:hypothetical protein
MRESNTLAYGIAWVKLRGVRTMRGSNTLAYYMKGFIDQKKFCRIGTLSFYWRPLSFRKIGTKIEISGIDEKVIVVQFIK